MPWVHNFSPTTDFQVIFKGIPKVMQVCEFLISTHSPKTHLHSQVADDMHRMTNYIEDMRNMFFGW